ncbi:MAG: hypothetical protein CMG75_09820 [Candidatus Marinimicrobia bacterium]|nr:hypothetical protein [Candidatus Neomarinimicrobiota bacterium]|tara:strand:- start:340 stop:807 length:468 start_codon:yes stop_codon:yes gene_type:complete
MIAYLSGGMENAPNMGSIWRDEISHWLDAELGHDVFNPVVHQFEVLTIEEMDEFRRWKLTAPEKFKTTVRKMIDADINAIESKIDYVICLWDKSALKGGGTHGEVTTAYRRGIPVYMITKIPSHKISSWIIGCCKREFNSFNELKAFLLKKYGLR